MNPLLLIDFILPTVIRFPSLFHSLLTVLIGRLSELKNLLLKMKLKSNFGVSVITGRQNKQQEAINFNKRTESKRRIVRTFCTQVLSLIKLLIDLIIFISATFYHSTTPLHLRGTYCTFLPHHKYTKIV